MDHMKNFKDRRSAHVDKQLLGRLGLPRRPFVIKLVHAWIEIHQDELMADWRLAIQGEPIFKIDPLK